MAALEVDLGYRAPSELLGHGRGADLRLATIDRTGRPVLYFDGFVPRAEQTARGLLSVAAVAGSWFSRPSGSRVQPSTDPLMTAGPDRLRFESLSLCRSIAARFELLRDGISGPPHELGTTTVDLNPVVRRALSRVRGLEPLHVAVGSDVTITTVAPGSRGRVLVPPEWGYGFAEAHAAGVALDPVGSYGRTAALRFLAGLPRTSTGERAVYAAPGQDGLRLSHRAGDGSIPLHDASRLRVLESTAPYLRSMTVYSLPATAPAISIWQLDLPGARFTVTLSPTATQGFTGELGRAPGFEEWSEHGYDPAEQAYFARRPPWLPAPVGHGTGRADGGADGLDRLTDGDRVA